MFLFVNALPGISGAGSMNMLGFEFFLDPGHELAGDLPWSGVKVYRLALLCERLRLGEEIREGH